LSRSQQPFWSAARLARVLSVTGMTGKDKAYPEFAATVLRLAREGKLPSASSWEADRALASPLGTLETQQVLEAELVGPEGNLRPQVAKILAWVHRQSGTLGVWKEMLDAKAGEAPPQDAVQAGDVKARWLQARAYAETAGDNDIPPHPIRGKRWLQQALQTAESSDLRLEVLRLLTAAYIDADQHDEGLAYLATVASQFPDEEVAALRIAIRKQKAAWIERWLGIVRRGAEQSEAKALEASSAGNEKLRAVYQRHADYYRQWERELLGMSQ